MRRSSAGLDVRATQESRRPSPLLAEISSSCITVRRLSEIRGFYEGHDRFRRVLRIRGVDNSAEVRQCVQRVNIVKNHRYMAHRVTFGELRRWAAENGFVTCGSIRGLLGKFCLNAADLKSSPNTRLLTTRTSARFNRIRRRHNAKPKAFWRSKRESKTRTGKLLHAMWLHEQSLSDTGSR